MTDLDVQIDDPDDEFESSVRVLNGDPIPPWFKVALIIVLGGLVALAVAGYLQGRLSRGDTPLIEPTAPTTPFVTPLASAEDSPAVESSLAAVEAWERFVRDGDLLAVAGTFDPAGPQFGRFEASAASSGREVDFSARNLSETQTPELTTVSMDLLVTVDGEVRSYPYDFVYLDGSALVWTVVDRRIPGTVALPPPDSAVESARQTWDRFTTALGEGDGPAALREVSAETQILADQLMVAASGTTVDQPVLADHDLFQVLVARVAGAEAGGPGDAVVVMLDPEQRQALLVGELVAWTQIDEERIIASLELGSQRLTTVPFTATPDGWSFDLRQALASSGGTSQ